MHKLKNCTRCIHQEHCSQVKTGCCKPYCQYCTYYSFACIIGGDTYGECDRSPSGHDLVEANHFCSKGELKI